MCKNKEEKNTMCKANLKKNNNKLKKKSKANLKMLGN
jgi:hypothetical protein